MGKLVVFEQLVLFAQTWLQLGKHFFYLRKLTAFGQNGCNWRIVVVFRQNGCIWGKWLYLGQMVVFVQMVVFRPIGSTCAEWLYLGKVGSIWAKRLYLGQALASEQNGCIWARLLYLGRSGSI